MRRSGHLNMPKVLVMGFLCSGKLDDLKDTMRNNQVSAEIDIWPRMKYILARYGNGMDRYAVMAVELIWQGGNIAFYGSDGSGLILGKEEILFWQDMAMKWIEVQ